MRTSHIAIHKRIAEKKGKLTDEEFFSSPQYAAYLTDIAEEIPKDITVQAVLRPSTTIPKTLKLHSRIIV